MQYPLRDYPNLKRGYKFRQKTTYSPHHLGEDLIIPIGTAIYAHMDGTVGQEHGQQMGLTVHFFCDRLIRYGHLQSVEKIGQVKKGDLIAYTGNSGSLTTGPHVHIDVSKTHVLNINDIDNFIDPYEYFMSKPEELPEWVEENQTIKWNKENDIITEWGDPLTPPPLYRLGEMFRKFDQHIEEKIAKAQIQISFNTHHMNDEATAPEGAEEEESEGEEEAEE
jgi:murein DD-endopeptidase MepM/ murein hydrolase activator NlpD